MATTDKLQDVVPTAATPEEPSGVNYNMLNISKTFIVAMFVVIGAIGIPSNILTICVYARLGFAETIHISYVALAMSDIGVLLSAVWVAPLASPALENYMWTRAMQELHLILGDVAAWTHITFTRSTALITAWISLERCICVLFPMKVKTLITRRLTISIIALIYWSSFTPFVMNYGSHLVEWQKQVQSNSTNFLIVLKVITPTREAAFLMTGTIYPIIYYFFLTTCTALLIIKLRQNSQWRATHSSTASSSEDKMSLKEARLIKTVVILACAFFVCSLPHIVSTLVSAYYREYSAVGSAKELFLIVNGIVYLFHEINSSTNIFVYTFLGTKFRETLQLVMKSKGSTNNSK